MILLSKLRQFKIYRNRSVLLDYANPKNKRIENLVLVFTDDLRKIIDVISSKNFIFRYYAAFFVNRVSKMKLVNGMIKTLRTMVKPIYDEVRESLNQINITLPTLSSYKNRNLIYSIHNELGLINNIKFSSPILYYKQLSNYFDTVLNNEGLSGYINKYLIFRIDDIPGISAAYFMKTNLTTPLQVFCYKLINDPASLIQLKGVKVIFINTTGIITWFEITDDIIAEGYDKSTLMRYLKIMVAANLSNVEELREYDNDFDDKNVPDEKYEEDIDSSGKLEKFVKDAIVSNTSTLDNTAHDFIKTKIASIIKKKSKIVPNLQNGVKSRLDNYEDDSDYDEYLDNETDDEIVDEPEYKDVDPVIDEHIEDEKEEPEDIDEDELLASLDTDDDEIEINQELITEVINDTKDATMNKELRDRLKRIAIIKDKYKSATLGKNGKSIKELLDDFHKTQIDHKELPIKNSINKEDVKSYTLADFDRSYYEKQLDPTILSMIKSFSTNKTIPMHIIKADKEDISDNLNALIRYKFNLEDEKGITHNITFDMPKLIDNKFFFINGTKKALTKQIVLIPIVKVAPNKVQIITNYNKAFLERFGRKATPKTEMLKKILGDINKGDDSKIVYKPGDSSDINKNYLSTLEYDELSGSVYSIDIGESPRCIKFCFNQHDIRILMEELDIEYKEDPKEIPVAILNNKNVISIDLKSGLHLQSKLSLCDLITFYIKEFSSLENVDALIAKTNIPKRLMYTRVKYLDRNISIGIFLSYTYGLKHLLDTMGVKYRFVKDKEKLTKEEGLDTGVIKFKDGFLYYDIYPLRHALVLNGISAEMSTEDYEFEEMNNPDSYLDVFDDLFGTRQMAKGFSNAKELMIDPVTVTVLEGLGLPTEFLEVYLYANSLLEDNSYTTETDVSINRIRGMELVPVIIYKELVKAYVNYKYKYNVTKKNSMSIKPDCVVKEMVKSRLFNEYDTINPIREAESQSAITFKGPGGINTDDAYSLEKRAYNNSMVGIIAASAPDSGNVGIQKYLTMNPRIINTLGFVKSGNDTSDISFASMGNIAELTTPFAIDHDDPKRLSFVTKESKHIIPVAHSDPLLITNGVEKALPFMASSDFIQIAKDKGEVLSVNEVTGIAIVKYSSGETEAIDIKHRVDKNGGGGFYILNKKKFNFKVGDKFEQNAVLVANPSYFSTRRGQPEYHPGTLANIGIMMSSKTFEDSAVISDRLAEKLSADVLVKKSIVLGAKSNISNIVKIGDYIQTGEHLITFEDELDNAEVTEVLASMSDDDSSVISDLVKHSPKSKYSGTIYDIKVYYTVPMEDMSESVKSVVTTYTSRINKRKNELKKFNTVNDLSMTTDFTGITKPIKGEIINGEKVTVGKVLIEIFIRYTDYPGAGDKVVFYASMKSVLQKVLSNEEMPYIDGNPSEHLDALLSPISVNARMVTSIIYALYGNKLVWGLKDKIKAMYSDFKTQKK